MKYCHECGEIKKTTRGLFCSMLCTNKYRARQFNAMFGFQKTTTYTKFLFTHKFGDLPIRYIVTVSNKEEINELFHNHNHK